MRITTRSGRHAARFGAGLATAALALTGLAVAPALADEPSPAVSSTFEDGSTAPWRARGGTSVDITDALAASGTRALAVSGRTANWHGVEAPLAGLLQPGQSYTISAKVRLFAGTGPTEIYVTSAENDSNYVRVATASVTDSAWNDISGTYTLPAGVSSGSLYFEAAAETASFYVDDIRITGGPVQGGADQGGAVNPDNDGADSGNTGDCPAAQATTKPAGLDDSRPLHEALPFPLGAAISSYAVNEPAARAALDQNFNQVTPENFMKVEAWYEGPWKFTTKNSEADALMDWAAQTHNRLYGHVLVWHSQTPDWFFQDDKGAFLTSSEADKAIARERMRTHIDSVAKYLSDRYGAFGSPTNPLVAFDVVNEVIADGANPESKGLRTSHWYRILGEEFIDLAFQYADEAFNRTYAAPGTTRPIRLFINEYNTENGTGEGTKTARYHALVERLLARGVPVDGVGHQFHVSLASNVANLAAAMDLFDDLPVVQAVTEMDVPTGTPVTEDVLRRQGSFYKSAFDIFRKQQAENKNIFSVTVWGLADEKSWRSCSGAPLVFDNDYDGKWAYAGILGLDIPKESQTLTVFGAADALDPASQTWEFMPETRISDEASFQARWNDKGVVVRVRAEDADVQATDAVKLTTADGSFRIPRSGGAVAGLDGVRVDSDAEGWTLTAMISMSAKAGDQIRLEAAVVDDGVEAGWNGGGLLGTLVLAEDLSSVFAPKAPVAPVVDGVIEEAWADAEALETGKQVEGADGASAKVRTLWSQDGDASKLHILFEVADSTPDVSSSEVHEQDSVEVFLDLGNRKSESYQDTDMQVRVNSDNVVTFGTGEVGAQEKRVTSAVVKNEGGYVVEMAIDLLDKAGDGSVHGFDAQVNDGVNGNRESVRIWADPTGNSWRSPARWGTLRLLGDPVGLEPSVTLSASEARRGQEISIAAQGFAPGETVEASFHSDPVAIGSAAADQNGAASFTFTIPKDAEIGDHEIRLVQEASGLKAVAALRVVGDGSDSAQSGASDQGASGKPGASKTPTGGLALTGAGIMGTMLAALAALGGGLALSRRRGE